MTREQGRSDNPEGQVMGLLEHLQDLRGAIVRSGLAILVFFFVALAFSNQIILFLKRPLIAVLPNSGDVLHFTGPMDVFVAGLKVSFLTGLILATPIWLYQFWKFLEPALYPSEKRYVLPFACASIFLFFAGVAFCYYVMLPLSLKFLIGIGMEVGTPLITINDYLSLLTILILGFGIVFETPLILILLVFLELISVADLRKNRRVIIVVILIVSAILTPPDPISQIAMAIPVYLMFEVAILVAAFLTRKRVIDKT